MDHREEVLAGFGRACFPTAPPCEQRARAKSLFAALDMDGNVRTWAATWQLDPACVRRVRLPLADGSEFDMQAYLHAQHGATGWLRDRMERHIGMATFADTWLVHHKPGKPHPERTVKSFVFQEAESISREAKVAWCARNGHAVASLQHDGIVVTLRAGTDAAAACAQMQRVSSLDLGYEQPCELKPPSMPEGVPCPSPRSLDDMAEVLTGVVHGAANHRPREGMWRHVPEWDTEQYTAAAKTGVLDDPVLRLHVRSSTLEAGGSVDSPAGVPITLDAAERTVMREVTPSGTSTAMHETRRALRLALDLHARHHFTHAAAVDGSCKEDYTQNGSWRRRLAYGVNEGMQRDGPCLWGARMHGDLEVPDAELHAIFAYLSSVVRRVGPRARDTRVLIQSDCLGVLDAVEASWRAGRADGLAKRDRGATLEALCRLREQLGLVVFMFTPSHVGIAPNAYADAAAKAHLDAPLNDGSGTCAVASLVTSRPVVYQVCSDFRADGTLVPQQDRDAAHAIWVTLDRGLFSAVRKRVSRWLHTHMLPGAHSAALDTTFIGRRGHHSESTTYAAVVRLGLRSERLRHTEPAPAERMAADAQRVSLVMTARNGEALGVRGAHDIHWRRAYDSERTAAMHGWATRHGRRGCAGCAQAPPVEAACTACSGWQLRGRRGRAHLPLARPGCVNRRLCTVCGGGLGDSSKRPGPTPALARAAHASRDDGLPGRANRDAGWCEGTRLRRRLGTLDGSDPQQPLRWAGFAGLHQTVVERLLRGDDGSERGTGAADAEVLTMPIADVRHVLGGTCAVGGAYASAQTQLTAAVRRLRVGIEASGGRGSELWHLVQLASGYLRSASDRRGEATLDEGWVALRRLMACDAPKPDWAAQGETDAAVEAQRKQIDVELTALWGELLVEAQTLRIAWQESSAGEVRRRADMEACRGVLRTLLRAWREVTDDVRAGAATFDQRWRARHDDAPLARRLRFGEGSSGLWWSAAGWRVRMLLAWVRLVHAGHVRKARRQSARWCERVRRGRQSALSLAWPGWSTPALSPDTARACAAATACEVARYNNVHAAAGTAGVTSGAAAVMARRAAAAAKSPIAPPPPPQSPPASSAPASHATRKRKMPVDTVAQRTPARTHARCGTADAPCPDPGVVDMDTTGGPSSSSQHAGSGATAGRPLDSCTGGAVESGARANGAKRLDAHLVFTTQARERLEERVGRWHWSPRFGDG